MATSVILITSLFISLICTFIGYFLLNKLNKKCPRFILGITFFTSFLSCFFVLNAMEFGQNIIGINKVFNDDINLPIDVMYGNNKLIKTRLALGLDPNRLYKIEIGNMSLLHIAGTFKQLEIAKLLIESGANVKTIALTHDQKLFISTFMAAIQGGSIELIDYLISKGVDINFKNYQGITAMHIAVTIGDMKVKG